MLGAELIAGADKLLKLRVDVGELGERDIIAGVRAAYEPQALIGRLIAVVANLEPRNFIRFIARRFLEFCRTVPEIVFALLFVVAFGLGGGCRGCWRWPFIP